jgi:hypothetical protein
MKIIRKPVKAIVECPMCTCVFMFGKHGWRTVEKNNSCLRESQYGIHCPHCKHFIKVIPGEVRCKK